MSKVKNHRKKVAARNARLNKGEQTEAKLNQDIASGMATPDQTRRFNQIQEDKKRGVFTRRNFNRKTS